MIVDILLFVFTVHSSVWLESNDAFNLNQNRDAQLPEDYRPVYRNHTYFPSPRDWRFPFYTVMPDRFVDGDPSNNQLYDESHEWDFHEVNFHHGGDMVGLMSRLDYIQSLGAKGIYVAGTPLLNLPWDSHYYNPYDFSVLDGHLGNVAEYREFVNEAHNRGLYVMIDMTISTAADLLYFEGVAHHNNFYTKNQRIVLFFSLTHRNILTDSYINQSAPFRLAKEYKVEYKYAKKWSYPDFQVNNTWDPSCNMNNFNITLYNADGSDLDRSFNSGCYQSSDFDQFGDIEAFGYHEPYERQFSKFAGVQDRLRSWHPRVARKLVNLACLTIGGLDIDAIRVDKATQFTANFATDVLAPGLRDCAKLYGKDNFFIPAEITSGVDFGTRYVGKGRKLSNLPPDMYASVQKNSSAIYANRATSGLDSAAFHYSIYRAFLVTVGLQGSILSPDDVGSDIIYDWSVLVQKMDYFNAYTGEFDPRDMFAVTNQDTFRYPSLVNGTARLRLGMMLTTLALPGIPTLIYGDEQGFFIHDSRTENYIYGRQPMTSAEAWQLHGCYQGKASYQFIDMPFSEVSRNGCHDDNQSIDKFDQTSDPYIFTQTMYAAHATYPILRDSFKLDVMKRVNMSDWSALWSSHRTYFPNQNSADNNEVWILYTNSSSLITMTDGCVPGPKYINAPFAKNGFKDIFPPFEVLKPRLGPDGTQCIDALTLPAFGYRVLMPIENFVQPQPALVGIQPSHDARIERTQEKLDITVSLDFTVNTIPCDSIYQQVSAQGSGGLLLVFDKSTISCSLVSKVTDYGIPAPVFRWSAKLVNVPDGVIKLSISSAIAASGPAGPSDNSLLASARSMFRVGKQDNVIVFPKAANYSTTMLKQSDSGFTITHTATGADRFRYTTDFSTTWTNWTNYEEMTPISSSTFNVSRSGGRKVLTVQYWCKECGSAAHMVSAELDLNRSPVPLSNFYTFSNLNIWGEFNGFGTDGGVPINMKKVDGSWMYDVVWTFPTNVSFDIRGDGKFLYGDVDLDGVIDRLPPNAQDFNTVSLPVPPLGYTGWRIKVDDFTHRYTITPHGSGIVATAYWFLLFVVPLFTGVLAVYLFVRRFHKVLWNQYGRVQTDIAYKGVSSYASIGHASPESDVTSGVTVLKVDEPKPKILMATLEYEIPDLKIKVRIGGLGVIASCVANFFDSEVVWVIPRVGDVVYPAMKELEPVTVHIFDEPYSIQVFVHQYRNIRFIMLESEIFRARTKKDPYTPKMDDLESGVFYSTWNQCISEMIIRENVDVYHINDFHCALAPLYLLPETIPCVVSLHNAEFQGLWPLRTKQEKTKVCSMFDISENICTRYIQYGNTFNLLHAATMYLKYHQKGLGIGGVSDSYGIRCHARYPSLWAIEEMSSIQNPNPADFFDKDKDIKATQINFAERLEFKRNSQKWAGIEVDDSKTLFVFVGRWCRQKGIDLIADLAPLIIEKYPNSQMICIGPIIDLYGKLAAIKLERVMRMYPTRVYSKPEFTQIPPFVFQGSDFVLLPSRDEPFGLVAVEFGRHGVLGIGSKIGGLGTMPGWWFPIESTEIPHLLDQFKNTIDLAMASSTVTRNQMILTAMNERFPVQEWKDKIYGLYSLAMKIQERPIGGHGNHEVLPDYDPTSGPGFSLRLRNMSWSSFSSPRSLVASRNSSFTSKNSRSRSSLGSFSISSQSTAHFKQGFRKSSSTSLVVSSGARQESSGNLRSISASPLGSTKLSQSADNINAKFVRNALIKQESDSKNIQNSQMNILSPDDIRTSIIKKTLSTNLIEVSSIGNKSKESTIHGSKSSFDDDETLKEKLARHKADFFVGTNNSFSSFDGGVKDIPDLSLGGAPLLTLSAVDHMNDFQEEEAFEQFNDEDGVLVKSFSSSMKQLNQRNTENNLCVSNAIKAAEKEFYEAASQGRLEKVLQNNSNSGLIQICQKIAQHRVRSWPLYTVLLALGQFVSASVYQVVLMTGSWYSTPLQLNYIAAAFLSGSLCWWTLYRNFSSYYTLALPFGLYGLSVFMVALPFSGIAGQYIKLAAVLVYAFASAAGSFYFALNFGEEAGVEMSVWIFRAAMIEGLRQLWTAIIYYWAQSFDYSTFADVGYFAPAVSVSIICFMLTVIFAGIAIILHFGLPSCYRHEPAKIPMFYSSILWRKLSLWFLLATFIQSYWLSGAIGRNFKFLWAQKIPFIGTLSMVLIFLLIWAGIMLIFYRLGKTYSWILPVFSVGLLSPLWAQMSWSTSNMGYTLFWAGAGGPYLSLALWLWLGVLASIQSTLTRVHVSATLILSQVIGAVAFVLARYTAPNSAGPADVFPDLSTGISASFLLNWVYWLGLFSQIVIALGYFIWFRKEQLSF